MLIAAFILGIIIATGIARLYVNRHYDVAQEKAEIVSALQRNREARLKNAQGN